jgi:cell division protein FtsB
LIKLFRLESPHRRWMAIFALWLIFLSGVFAKLFGSPGIIQAIRLQALLQEKQKSGVEFEAELSRLKIEAALLETHSITQEKEIRKTLGYTAPDEIIFDFTLLE